MSRRECPASGPRHLVCNARRTDDAAGSDPSRATRASTMGDADRGSWGRQLVLRKDRRSELRMHTKPLARSARPLLPARRFPPSCSPRCVLKPRRKPQRLPGGSQLSDRAETDSNPARARICPRISSGNSGHRSINWAKSASGDCWPFLTVFRCTAADRAAGCPEFVLFSLKTTRLRVPPPLLESHETPCFQGVSYFLPCVGCASVRASSGWVCVGFSDGGLGDSSAAAKWSSVTCR